MVCRWCPDGSADGAPIGVSMVSRWCPDGVSIGVPMVSRWCPDRWCGDGVSTEERQDQQEVTGEAEAGAAMVIMTFFASCAGARSAARAQPLWRIPRVTSAVLRPPLLRRLPQQRVLLITRGRLLLQGGAPAGGAPALTRSASPASAGCGIPAWQRSPTATLPHGIARVISVGLVVV